MRKIPTVLQRDPEDRSRVTDEVSPGCEWVLAGEGVATRKYDGTCTMLDADGTWWARREVKPGKTPPAGFRAEETDATTGKTVGWEPIAQSPFAKMHAEALEQTTVPASGPPAGWIPGTYELIGPKVNGNPEHAEHHQLIHHRHAERIASYPLWHPDSSREQIIAQIRSVVAGLGAHRGIEGIVWHHPDGRMAKLKARDVR